MPALAATAHTAVMSDTPNPAASNALSTERLIELGRDREAVASARQELRQRLDSLRTNSTIGGSMDGVQQLEQIVPMLDAIVDGIRPDQLDHETACTNFTVAGVLEHMIGGATAFAPAFRGSPAPAELPPAAEGESTHDRFHQAMAELLRAVRTPGAQDRTIAAPFGEVPGHVFARFVAFDGLVHGWDLATATGQSYNPPDKLVGEVDAFARQALTPEMRDGDTFADETNTPADASDLVRLVAFTGRHV
jgi:uncharacterized protein (TIGR03086 family)